MSIKHLSSISLFASLPAEETKKLESTLTPCEFPEGKVLIQEGQADNKFYILLEGQAEVIKSLDLPEERVLGTREAGNLLGEMSLFSKDGVHTASVRSLTPLRLFRVTRNELDALLHRQPLFAYEIIRVLSHRLDESENLTILDLKEKNQRLMEAYEELKAAQQQMIEKERLEKELEIAGQIQQSILPETLPTIAGYQFGALMIPARVVGGDFFTFFKLDNNRLGIVVGDVSDKGVPSSLFMALTYSLIRAEAVRTSSPVEAFHKVNEHLLQMNTAGMFITLVYGILDAISGDFHFARAGHLPPFLMDGEGQAIEVPMSTGQPLGLFENTRIDEQHILIPQGGLLLLYSDGISETTDTHGVDFGADKLQQTMTAIRHQPAQQVCKKLWEAVQNHGENQPQQDDFTTVVVQRILDKN